jgi:hypothetical protein
MPAALALLLGLTVIERIWFPLKRQRPAPAIDTSLEAVRGRPPAGDEVVIEPEPEPFVAEADDLSADLRALGAVRDDTFFREADTDAWLQTWNTLMATGRETLAKAPAARVSFAELFGQPRSFRGRLVRMKGVFHRVEELTAPANSYSIDRYWQGWLEPAGGPVSPVVVQFLQVPEGMPTGLKIHEPVEVTGYFFKRYAYNAADTIRVAPLVMSLVLMRSSWPWYTPLSVKAQKARIQPLMYRGPLPPPELDRMCSQKETMLSSPRRVASISAKMGRREATQWRRQSSLPPPTSNSRKRSSFFWSCCQSATVPSSWT